MKIRNPKLSSSILVLLGITVSARADLLSGMKIRAQSGQTAQEKQQQIDQTVNDTAKRDEQKAVELGQQVGGEVKNAAEAAAREALSALNCQLSTTNPEVSINASFDPSAPDLVRLDKFFPNDSDQELPRLWVYRDQVDPAQIDFKITKADGSPTQSGKIQDLAQAVGISADCNIANAVGQAANTAQTTISQDDISKQVQQTVTDEISNGEDAAHKALKGVVAH